LGRASNTSFKREAQVSNMKLLDNISTVIFDLFCTLTVPKVYDNEGGNEYSILNIDKAIWEKMYEECYYDGASGKIKDPIELIANIALRINPNFSKELIEKAAKSRMNIFYECLINIDPVILLTLEKLKKLSKKLVLISNANIIDKMSWNDSPLFKYFDLSIFSYDIGSLKPDRRIYEIALKKLKIKSEDCLYIGDGGHDELKGSKEMGMKTILTTYFIKYLWPEKINGLKRYADFEVDSIEEIINLQCRF